MNEPITTLIVPGLHGSGQDHWQTWWQYQDRHAVRVEQADCHTPDLEAWSSRVHDAVLKTQGKVWIVAHSFGCLASLHATQACADRIAGLFLVAMADPDKFNVTSRLPKSLNIPSVLVASRSDPWLSFDKARHWATVLNSRFIDLGDAGHINIEAGYGPWREGLELFGNFRRNVETEQAACH